MITEERLAELERQFASERHSFFRGVLPLQISDDDAELLFTTIRTLRAENEGLKAAWEFVKQLSEYPHIQLSGSLLKRARAIVGDKP